MQPTVVNTLWNENISETFERLYVAKQGRAQDNLLNKKSGALYSKAVDSAVDITDRALDIVKESTLKKNGSSRTW